MNALDRLQDIAASLGSMRWTREEAAAEQRVRRMIGIMHAIREELDQLEAGLLASGPPASRISVHVPGRAAHVRARPQVDPELVVAVAGERIG